jgi:hypothetical protein
VLFPPPLPTTFPIITLLPAVIAENEQNANIKREQKNTVAAKRFLVENRMNSVPVRGMDNRSLKLSLFLDIRAIFYHYDRKNASRMS